MSKASVSKVIQRAVSDAAFRRQLQSDPGAALKGFDLSADERAAITSGDPARLTSLGIDQRMSKAFLIGGLAGASKNVIEFDPGHAAGDEVIVGDPGTAAVTAFDSTTASGDLNTLDAGMVESRSGALDSTSTAGDLNTIDAGTVESRSGALDSTSTAGDLNTIDAGAPTGTFAVRDEAPLDLTGDGNRIDAGLTGGEAGGASAVRDVAPVDLTGSATDDGAAGGTFAVRDVEPVDLTGSAIDEGAAGGTSAVRDVEPVDLTGNDSRWGGDATSAGEVTAFEPASSSAGDLNTLDAGIVSDETGAASGLEDSGLDSGGDIRPTEH